MSVTNGLNPRQCALPECDVPAEREAPVALCRQHLALAAEWVSNEFGVDDVLPSPCLACGSRVGVCYPSGWVCAVCEWVYGTVPADDVAPPRTDVVYYIRFDDRMKIGTTSNLRQRMSQLWHHELVALERGDRAREQARHAQFATERLGRSEWFDLSPALMRHVDSLAAGGEPWTMYARWRSEAAALLA